MTWLLIVIAVSAETAGLLQPNEMPRSSMAVALQSMYVERVLVKDVTDGIAFETRSACRAALHVIESRGPDSETTPDGGNYKRLCKLIRKETS